MPLSPGQLIQRARTERLASGYVPNAGMFGAGATLPSGPGGIEPDILPGASGGDVAPGAGGGVPIPWWWNINFGEHVPPRPYQDPSITINPANDPVGPGGYENTTPAGPSIGPRGYPRPGTQPAPAASRPWITPNTQSHWDYTRGQMVANNNATGAQFNSHGANLALMAYQAMGGNPNNPGTTGDEGPTRFLNGVMQLDPEGGFSEIGQRNSGYRRPMTGNTVASVNAYNALHPTPITRPIRPVLPVPIPPSQIRPGNINLPLGPLGG